MIDPIPEGKMGFQKSTGQRVVRQGGKWVPVQQGKPQVQEASMRGRMDLGLAPMVEAQEGMAAIERQGNPFGPGNRDNLAARVMSDAGLDIPAAGIRWRPMEGLAKSVGGEDFQAYQQAAKAFESQLMPIMSGAAVSPSEAERQIKAALPEPGDSPAVLQAKARTRAMMLNGAAKARNLPLPYPDVPTWGINSLKVGDGAQSAPSVQGGGQRVLVYDPKTGKLVPR